MYGKRIAVLIPAHNEERVLGHTLRSVLSAGVLAGDIFVVDDGSTDATATIAAQFAVNVHRNPRNMGKAKAIGRAAQSLELAHRYGIIALLDADTEVNQGYFQVMRRAFMDPTVAVVCGQVKSLPHNWLTAYRALVYFVSQRIYKAGQSEMGVIMVAPGCAASYRAEVFAAVNWFALDTLVEDMEATVQIQQAGLGHISYQPDAIVHTQDPRTLSDYARQMFRWHRGTWQVGWRYGLISEWRNKLALEYKLMMGEGLLFSVALFTSPLWYSRFPRAILWAVVVDTSFTLAMASLCSIVERRADVVLYVLTYPFVRILDSLIFVSAFFGTIRNKLTPEWARVSRY